MFTVYRRLGFLILALTKILVLAPSICYFVGEIVLGIYLLKAAEAVINLHQLSLSDGISLYIQYLYV